MTDDRLTLLKAEMVSLELPPSVVEGDHSFKSYTHAEAGDERITVMIGPDTFFEYDYDRYRFCGVRWFPGVDGDDPMAAKTELRRHRDHAHLEGVIGGTFTFRLSMLVDMLERDKLQPAEQPEREAL